MTKMLTFARALWRSVVPESIRSSESVIQLKSSLLPHNWQYDESYFLNEVDDAATESASDMADCLMLTYSPRTIVDVGCGTGALAKEMISRGVQVEGLEYAEAAISICRSRGVSVQKFDIETQDPPYRKVDLVLSFEVAEHLPERISNKYVSVLCAMGDQVIISAAPPGQGGTDHVNEQPPEYWVKKFEGSGFEEDTARTRQIRECFSRSDSIAGFYRENTMAFRRIK